jgi:hypothetical protein
MSDITDFFSIHMEPIPLFESDNQNLNVNANIKIK